MTETSTEQERMTINTRDPPAGQDGHGDPGAMDASSASTDMTDAHPAPESGYYSESLTMSGPGSASGPVPDHIEPVTNLQPATSDCIISESITEEPEISNTLLCNGEEDSEEFERQGQMIPEPVNISFLDTQPKAFTLEALNITSKRTEINTLERREEDLYKRDSNMSRSASAPVITENKYCDSNIKTFDKEELTDGQFNVLDQDSDGDTCLHLAIIYLLQGLVCHILRLVITDDLRSLLNLKNYLFQTPLHLAVLTAQHRLVRLLTVLGSSPDARDKRGNTALHLAARAGDLKAVRALHSPITQRDRKSVKSLLDKDCVDVGKSRIPSHYLLNYDGETCLHIAASRGHTEVVKYLLENVGCDANQGDGRSGRTILHYAVELNNHEIFYLLISNKKKYRIDLDAQTYEGHTALKLAYSRRSSQLISQLIVLGVDVSLAVADLDEESWVS